MFNSELVMNHVWEKYDIFIKKIKFIFRLSMLFLICSFLVPVYTFSSYTEMTVEYKAYKQQYSWLNETRYHIIKDALKTYKYVPISLVCAVIEEESHGDPNVVSHAGASGLMQVMRVWVPDMRINLKDEVVNITWGIRILNACILHSNGNLEVALKSYNSGMNSFYFNWKYIAKVLAHHTESLNRGL